MRSRALALMIGLALLLSAAAVGYSQRIVNGSPESANSLAGAVAKKTRLPLKTVQTVLDAVGPELTAIIQKGDVVVLPKMGKIRVVRVKEHKDIERGTGKVLTIPSRNYVTLDVEESVATAVNLEGVQPNEVVVQFQYNVLPGQTPAQRTESMKVRSLRTQ